MFFQLVYICIRKDESDRIDRMLNFSLMRSTFWRGVSQREQREPFKGHPDHPDNMRTNLLGVLLAHILVLRASGGPEHKDQEALGTQDLKS